MNAEFEEKEYENPLNVQLLFGSYELWTPGQVFEGNFGIDSAMKALNPTFWNYFNLTEPLSGVDLSDFHLQWGWSKSTLKDAFPDFGLNLFLQIKRPESIRRRTVELKEIGLKNPYWRFRIKQHQQELLIKLKSKVVDQAIVAYACSAFHTKKDLFKFTKERTIVNNSNFVKVEKLDNHKIWIFDNPGSNGIAMSKPEKIDSKYLFDEINEIRLGYNNRKEPVENLRSLERAIYEVFSDLQGKDDIADEYLYRRDELDKLPLNEKEKFFLKIINFCNILNLNWFVFG